MTPLSATESWLLVVHIVMLVINMIVFLETLKARDAEPMVIDKEMFKVVRPGDVAIVHFERDLSERAHASFKAALGGIDNPPDALVCVLESCRSVLVLQLAEKLGDSGSDGKSRDDESAATDDKSIDRSAESA